MSDIRYCRVTFDDGTQSDLKLGEFHRLHRAMLEYAATGQEQCFLAMEIVGTHTCFYISKVQDVIMSTPENRKYRDQLNAQLRDEIEENNEEKPPWL